MQGEIQQLTNRADGCCITDFDIPKDAEEVITRSTLKKDPNVILTAI